MTSSFVFRHSLRLSTSSDLLPALQSAPIGRSSRQSHRKVATLSYAQESDGPVDFQIFDIFDAPSRLGESSKLLVHSHSSSSSTTSPSRPFTTSAQRKSSPRKIEPLPTPIIFDGPAQPRHISFMSYRVARHRSYSSSDVSKSLHTFSSLPEPIVFDGPSRLRSYARGSPAGNAQSEYPQTMLMLMLGAAGAAALAGYVRHDPMLRQDRNS